MANVPAKIQLVFCGDYEQLPPVPRLTLTLALVLTPTPTLNPTPTLTLTLTLTKAST